MFLYMWEMRHYKINGHAPCKHFQEVFGIIRDFVFFYRKGYIPHFRNRFAYRSFERLGICSPDSALMS